MCPIPQVVTIPTHKPPARTDLNMRLYWAEEDKLAYVVDTVEACWRARRPVLIGELLVG